MATRGRFFYGWVVVAVGAILLATLAGTMYSFGVFFKPMIADFGWSRAAMAGVYSTFLVTHGVFAIPTGWLADRFGPSRVMVFCGFMVGLGLVLSSQVNALWQFYVTYGLIMGIGAAGPFVIGTSTAARWFVKRRGIVLGIVVAGLGLGTLILIPLVERLIATFGWSRTYFLLGIAASIVMIASALLLRRDPEQMGQLPYGAKAPHPSDASPRLETTPARTGGEGIALVAAVRSKPLWMLVIAWFFFNFSVQTVMAHLVNYATDLGISALVGATFVSVIGIGSVTGRLTMGTISDRIGGNNALIICCSIQVIALVWLIFVREVWMFYLFAAVFGFGYGGDVPQLPVLVGRFFGLRAVAALVGVVVLGANTGGALGSWAAGQIFDLTNSYLIALVVSAAASLLTLIAAIALKKQRSLVT